MAIWDNEAAARSTELATEELQKMLAALPETEKAGAKKIVDWMNKWYNGTTIEGKKVHATGWKALCHQLQKLVR